MQKCSPGNKDIVICFSAIFMLYFFYRFSFSFAHSQHIFAIGYLFSAVLSIGEHTFECAHICTGVLVCACVPIWVLKRNVPTFNDP